MLLDWKNYRNQLLARVSDLGKLTPGTLKGYQALGAAGEQTGHLDAKTRELIALACSVTARCDGCITVHAEAAARHGATRDEVAETLGVAIALGAGAALVYSARTLDAFNAHSGAGGV
jgi:AhpD family alkylhydroperoxidase